jgi:hypothetical protein
MIAEHAKRAQVTSPLSMRERADLDRLETIISRGRKVFREVALALLEIRDRRLYRTSSSQQQSSLSVTVGCSKQAFSASITVISVRIMSSFADEYAI